MFKLLPEEDDYDYDCYVDVAVDDYHTNWQYFA